MTTRKIDVLSAEDSYERLASAQVGRLVYVDEVGPAAIPVNFAVLDRDIVFRSETSSGHQHIVSQPVGFEVDDIDEQESSGWSVLVRGRAHEVPIDEVPRLLALTGSRFPKPWAAGVHNVWFRLEVQSVSGRRLTAAYTEPAF
jgi:nitroimidazol reductase NimA-like FMN-containing flavoprotein (pyridoxamine 5'-phosphate oxidase superfamily)